MWGTVMETFISAITATLVIRESPGSGSGPNGKRWMRAVTLRPADHDGLLVLVTLWHRTAPKHRICAFERERFWTRNPGSRQTWVAELLTHHRETGVHVSALFHHHPSCGPVPLVSLPIVGPTGLQKKFKSRLLIPMNRTQRGDLSKEGTSQESVFFGSRIEKSKQGVAVET